MATSSSSNSEHAAAQLPSCTQKHSPQQDTPQQHPSRDADTSRTVNTAQQLHSSPALSDSDRQLPQLPQLTVSGVSPEVFQLVLEFVYSGSLQVLPPRWLKAAGAELLFEAAQRYLMPLLKVQAPAMLHHPCVWAHCCCESVFVSLLYSLLNMRYSWLSILLGYSLQYRCSFWVMRLQ